MSMNVRMKKKIKAKKILFKLTSSVYHLHGWGSRRPEDQYTGQAKQLVFFFDFKFTDTNAQINNSEEKNDV